MDVREFLIIELGLKRPASSDHNDFFNVVSGIIQQQPSRNINHHVTHSDDGNALPG